MKRILTFAAVALLATVGVSNLQAQSDPAVGTWKLNIEKSKFDPGPAPKSQTRKVEAQGDGLKYTFEGVGADGKAVTYGFTAKFDGKDNPIMGSHPSGADSISAIKTDANHYEATLKKGGKVVGTGKVSISADGKVTTVEASGTNAAGAKTHDMLVYDRQ